MDGLNTFLKFIWLYLMAYFGGLFSNYFSMHMCTWYACMYVFFAGVLVSVHVCVWKLGLCLCLPLLLSTLYVEVADKNPVTNAYLPSFSSHTASGATFLCLPEGQNYKKATTSTWHCCVDQTSELQFSCLHNHNSFLKSKINHNLFITMNWILY